MFVSEEEVLARAGEGVGARRREIGFEEKTGHEEKTGQKKKRDRCDFGVVTSSPLEKGKGKAVNRTCPVSCPRFEIAWPSDAIERAVFP